MVGRLFRKNRRERVDFVPDALQVGAAYFFLPMTLALPVDEPEWRRSMTTIWVAGGVALSRMIDTDAEIKAAGGVLRAAKSGPLTVEALPAPALIQKAVRAQFEAARWAAALSMAASEEEAQDATAVGTLMASIEVLYDYLISGRDAGSEMHGDLTDRVVKTVQHLRGREPYEVAAWMELLHLSVYRCLEGDRPRPDLEWFDQVLHPADAELGEMVPPGMRSALDELPSAGSIPPGVLRAMRSAWWDALVEGLNFAAAKDPSETDEMIAWASRRQLGWHPEALAAFGLS